MQLFYSMWTHVEGENRAHALEGSLRISPSRIFLFTFSCHFFSPQSFYLFSHISNFFQCFKTFHFWWFSCFRKIFSTDKTSSPSRSLKSWKNFFSWSFFEEIFFIDFSNFKSSHVKVSQKWILLSSNDTVPMFLEIHSTTTAQPYWLLQKFSSHLVLL